MMWSKFGECKGNRWVMPRSWPRTTRNWYFYKVWGMNIAEDPKTIRVHLTTLMSRMYRLTVTSALICYRDKLA